jgi:hypothetical protein
LQIIRRNAFSGVRLSENEIELPNSVNSVANNIFPENITVNWLNRFIFRGSTLIEFVDNHTGNYTTPSFITHIGPRAFEGNTGIRNLTIHSRVVDIGYAAFRGSMITQVFIPSTVIWVREEAFANCQNLFIAQVAAREIGERAFANSRPLLLHILEGTERIRNQAFMGSLIMHLTIFANLHEIGDEAFRGCAFLLSVTFSDNGRVHTIGERAFQDCRALTSFDFSVVTNLGAYAFKDSGLTGVLLHGGLTMGEGVFKDSERLESVTFGGSHFGEISARAFQNCIALEAVAFPGFWGVSSIGANAFENTKIDNVWIYATSIGESAFANNPYLRSVRFASSNTGGANVRFINDNAFRNTGLLMLEVPETVVIMGSHVFADNVHLTEAWLFTVGDYAFYGNTSLTRVSFGEFRHAFNIGTHAFKDVQSLTTARFGSGRYSTIGYGAFRNTGLTEVSISSDALIDDYAFADCDDLERVMLSGRIAIGDFAFYGTGVEEVGLNSVDSIGHSAFMNNSNLLEIDLPNTLQWIDYDAFLGTGISNITIPESVSFVGPNAFENNVAVTWHYRHGMEANTFSKNLSRVVVRDGITSIGARAFAGAESLTEVEVRGRIEHIGYRAFASNYSFSGMAFPHLRSIGERAFYRNTSMTNFHVPHSVTNIGANAFQGSTALTVSTEVSDPLSGWNANWNSGITVNWGSKLVTYTVGTKIFAGDTLVGVAERLSDHNVPAGGRRGFKIVFCDGSQLVFKHHNHNVNNWELYRWFPGDRVEQLYNADGWRVNSNVPYTFKATLTITGIYSMQNMPVGNPANEIGNFYIMRG